MASAVVGLRAAAGAVDFVDPLIGTDFTGNTYPGAQVPFGMVQLSPDNGLSGWDRIAGYFYPDSTIAGFSHTHLSGTGAGDLYDISFMPVTLPPRVAPGELGIHSRFSHDRETARAGYYAVRLSDYGIDVELTATPRCGIQRYTFPGGPAAVVVNLAKAMNWDATLGSAISMPDSLTLEGWRHSDGWARNQQLWFRSRLSMAPDSISITALPLPSGGEGVTARLYYNTRPGQQLTIATALSATGPGGAALNLVTEAPHDDFDRYRREAREAWARALDAIRVETADTAALTKFHTALYHSMLAPTVYCDADSAYRGPDGLVHPSPGFVTHSTFSLWDTFRTLHPLLTIAAPARARDMALSIIRFAEEQGRLPVWNFQGSETDMMIGYHAAAVLTDAVLKDMLTPAEAARALDACVATATLDPYRQIGLYRRLGYVPCDAPGPDAGWSMSKTLEYAYDDHCIAILARHLGCDSVAAVFERRAGSWRNHLNPATLFLEPRDSAGRFDPGFDPAAQSPHICESNAWQYLWAVPHDIPGLIDALGGPDAFAARLNRMLTENPAEGDSIPIFSTGMIGRMAHGNEPVHHVAWLHNSIGRPDLTRHYVRRIIDELYTTGPAGLCGNDDCGQLSAWLVMAAIGLYPVDPATATYSLGGTMFDRVSIATGPERRLTIVSADGPPTLDGRPLDKLIVTHRELLDASTLTLPPL